MISSPSSRSPLFLYDLDDIGFDFDRVYLPDIAVPGTVSDLHYADQAVLAALYDILCAAYRQHVDNGTSGVEAFNHSALQTGGLMFRALLFAGEHRVPLSEYGDALVRADESRFSVY